MAVTLSVNASGDQKETVILEEFARSQDVPTPAPFPVATSELSAADTLRATHLAEREQIDATPLDRAALEATDDE